MTILSTALFYTPGWCLVSYASTVSMLYIGRIFTGIAVGMSSLAVPVSLCLFACIYICNACVYVYVCIA